MNLKHALSYTQCWEWCSDTTKYSVMREVTTRECDELAMKDSLAFSRWIRGERSSKEKEKKNLCAPMIVSTILNLDSSQVTSVVNLHRHLQRISHRAWTPTHFSRPSLQCSVTGLPTLYHGVTLIRCWKEAWKMSYHSLPCGLPSPILAHLQLILHTTVMEPF